MSFGILASKWLANISGTFLSWRNPTLFPRHERTGDLRLHSNREPSADGTPSVIIVGRNIEQVANAAYMIPIAWIRQAVASPIRA
jgi:hypothetical protein